MIMLPSLKEREGDALLLANAFLRRFAGEAKRKLTGFTSQASQALERYPWPGNVRELENRVKRAVIMAEGTKVTPADLEMGMAGDKFEGKSLKEAREELERDLILRTLERAKDNITRAAEELGISRPTLYELMEKLGIQRKG
jgi:two-component system NtrC family response regulator